jgi:hypothetical protein
MLPASKSRLAAMATFFLFASVGDAVAQSRVVAKKRYTQVVQLLSRSDTARNT